MAPRDAREMAKLSVVIPLYEEAESIDELLSSLSQVLAAETAAYEIICVDDGSSPETWNKLVAWRTRLPTLVAISLSRNFGKEIAITAGLDVADGDAVIVMDGDLQHPPESIPALLARWREGYDMVYGVRRDRSHDPAARRHLSRTFYRVFNALSTMPITPDAGDFRLMDRKVVDAIGSMRERARFMKGIYSWVGFKSVGVEFDVAPRHHGRSNYSSLRLFRLAFDGILSFSTVPLKAAVVVGATIATIAIALGAFYVLRTLVFGVDVPGFASVFVSILGLSGLIILQLGMMGLYLGRIYEEVKARPLYVIRDMVGKTAAATVHRREEV